MIQSTNCKGFFKKMISNQKYIVFALEGKETIFTFPKSVDHDRMAEAIYSIRIGGINDWSRKYREGELISAGFVDNGICHGYSETLKLKSRAELDTALLHY